MREKEIRCNQDIFILEGHLWEDVDLANLLINLHGFL